MLQVQDLNNRWEEQSYVLVQQNLEQKYFKKCQSTQTQYGQPQQGQSQQPSQQSIPGNQLPGQQVQQQPGQTPQQPGTGQYPSGTQQPGGAQQPGGFQQPGGVQQQGGAKQPGGVQQPNGQQQQGGQYPGQEQCGQQQGSGQSQGQMGQGQGQMGQGQGQKLQEPPQSKGQWTQDSEQLKQFIEVEVTFDENEILFKDRCVAQTCENLDKVQAIKKNLPMKFDVKADFNDNKDVIVQLAFPYKKDKPLVKSDGNVNACIERQIYRYRPCFLSETLDDSTIESSYDDDKQLRTWEFTILNADIDSKLFKDEQTDKVVYTGYYSVKLTIQEKKLVQFFFTFFVAVDLDGNALAAQTTSEAQDDTPTCATEDNCVSRAATEVYAGQNFYVVQRVKQTGFEQWKVGDADVTITCDGLNKKLKFIQQQKQPGQTIYTLNVDILTNNVEFSVNGKLEDPNSARRFRFLQDSTTIDGAEVSSAKAVGSTTLECIKKGANSLCPTAEEAKAYNKPDWGTIGQIECESNNGLIWSYLIFAVITLVK